MPRVIPPMAGGTGGRFISTRHQSHRAESRVGGRARGSAHEGGLCTANMEELSGPHNKGAGSAASRMTF